MPDSIVDTGELESRLLLGRYRVVKRLAEGGMGTVYLARTEGAEGFTRPVVVKFMKANLRSEESEMLFSREAKILSKMQHPSVLNVIDFGIEQGAYVMVLDYVHGYSLMQWMDYRYTTSQPIPVDLCLYIARRILSALNYAHHFDTDDGQNIAIVHRDVAPDNVLISRKGHVRLLDFGIAKIHGDGGHPTTKSGTFRGKLGYAAPETLEGAEATAKSDQYSAGIVLLEMFSFETPFAANSMGESVQRMMNEVPAPVSNWRTEAPPGLDGIVARAVEKSPEDRFESVLDFSTALKRLQKKDDEELSRELGETLRSDYELLPQHVDADPLKDLEEALARKLPDAPAANFSAQASSGYRPQTLVDTEESAGGGRGNNSSLLIGISVAAAGLALALGAVLAFSGRGPDSDKQVVVFGNDNSDTGAIAAPELEPTPAATAGETVPSAALAAESTAAKPTRAPSPKASLEASLKAQSGAIENCFALHFHQSKSPEAFLHFSVPPAGGQAQVRVDPAAVRSTPLGICLKNAGSAVRFAPQSQAVSFRVPVRAQVSRLQKK